MKRRSKFMGCFLALFLGGLGLHQAYIGNYKRAFIYAFFGPTGIPSLIGIIETIFMPNRIEKCEGKINWSKFFLYPFMGVVFFFILFFTLIYSSYFLTNPVEKNNESAKIFNKKRPLSGSFSEKLEKYPDLIKKDKNLATEIKKILRKIEDRTQDVDDLYHERFVALKFEKYLEKFRQTLHEDRYIELQELTDKEYTNSGIGNYVKPRFNQEGNLIHSNVNLTRNISLSFSGDARSYKIEVYRIGEKLFLGEILIDGIYLYQIDKGGFIYTDDEIEPIAENMKENS